MSEHLEIRVITPAYFLATKFEAFRGRGKDDFFSHDLEDIVFVMENSHNLIVQLNECPAALKYYFAEQAGLLINDQFLNVLPGLLENPASEKMITNILAIMAGWRDV